MDECGLTSTPVDKPTKTHSICTEIRYTYMKHMYAYRVSTILVFSIAMAKNLSAAAFVALNSYATSEFQGKK